MEIGRESVIVVSQSETVPWPVYWTGVWVGALASIALALLFGLVGIALGFHLLGPSGRIIDWHKFGIGTLIFSVCGAFFSGVLRSEPAMLHGAIVWLVTVPLLLMLAGLGAGSYFGGWYGGLAGQVVWATPPDLPSAPGVPRNTAARSV